MEFLLAQDSEDRHIQESHEFGLLSHPSMDLPPTSFPYDPPTSFPYDHSKNKTVMKVGICGKKEQGTDKRAKHYEENDGEA